jgi:hypothetical protein
VNARRKRFLLSVLGLLLAGSTAGCDVVLRKLIAPDVDEMSGVYKGDWTLRTPGGAGSRRDGAVEIRIGILDNDISGAVRVDRDRYPLEGRYKPFSGIEVRVEGGVFERSTRLEGYADCDDYGGCHLTLEGTAPGSGVRIEFRGHK